MKNILQNLQDHPGRVILIATGFYLFLGSWQDGLNLDAAMYASVARNIAESGNWLSMHFTDFYFSQFAEHPPLGIWGMALVFKIFGANDTTSRFIGALSAFGSVAMIYVIGREALGKAYGFFASFILLVCINFVSITNSALLDGPVTFFMILAYWSVANHDQAKRRLPLGGIALALAFMSKGLVAVPAYLAIFAYVLIFRRDLLSHYQPYLTAALSLAIPGIYIIIDITIGPDHFWGHYFGTQIGEIYEVLRPVAEAKWYEFFWRYLVLFIPWSVISIVGARLIIKKRETRLFLVLIALGSALFVYSFSHFVFNHYFAPVYPLGALIAAYPIHLFLKHRAISLRRFPLYFLAVLLTAFCIIPFTSLKVHHLRLPDINKLTPYVESLTVNNTTPNGVYLGRDTISWNMIGLTSWYWRSSLNFITDSAYSIQSFIDDPRFAYLVTSADYTQAQLAENNGRLKLLSKTNSLALYVRIPASSKAQ